MQRAIVVLPLPDSPTSATHSPARDRERDVLRGDDASRRRARCVAVERGDLERAGSLARPRGRAAAPVSTAAASAPLEAADAMAVGDRLRGRAVVVAPFTRSRQRGANAQPVPRSPMPAATPGIPRSRRGASGSGMAETRPSVYGCRGACNTSAAGSLLHDAPGVHHGDPVGDRADDGQVVRDVDDAEAGLVCELPDLLRRPCWTTTSSPVVGSSRTTTAGRHTSAMAIATRCCCPPESWWGNRRRKPRSYGSATCGSASSTPQSPRRRAWARSIARDLVTDPDRRVERRGGLLRDVGDEPSAHAPEPRSGARSALRRRPRSDPPPGGCRAGGSRAARARSWSSRCPIRRRGRGSRRARSRT